MKILRTYIINRRIKLYDKYRIMYWNEYRDTLDYQKSQPEDSKWLYTKKIESNYRSHISYTKAIRRLQSLMMHGSPWYYYR